MKIAYVINGPAHTPMKHFARQLGITHAVTSPFSYNFAFNPFAHQWDYMILREIKQEMNDYGMEWDVLEGVNFIDGVKLGLESRDEEIAHFCTLLENMGKLGIKTVCYNWMPVWGWYRSRLNIDVGGGATVTGFNLDDVKDAPGCGITISKDELWANLKYFLEKVVPVAEKNKVKLAVHPDDPPVDCIAGVERILTSSDAMWEVTQLVQSEYNGITLCQGTFATMGENIPAAIRRFGNAGLLHFAHFRDIQGTATNFHETFHHAGKTDMYEAMKCYYEVGFDGVCRPDHVPTMYGDATPDMPAYAVNANLVPTGYMLGLIEAVEKEMGIRK